MLAPLLRATAAIDLPELRATMDAAAHSVRICFRRYIEEAT
jgi:hypothetical protein